MYSQVLLPISQLFNIGSSSITSREYTSLYVNDTRLADVKSIHCKYNNSSLECKPIQMCIIDTNQNTYINLPVNNELCIKFYNISYLNFIPEGYYGEQYILSGKFNFLHNV